MRWLYWLVDALLIVASLLMFALFAETVAGRMGYPYDLEWMEGGMLLHAKRVLDGELIYVSPTADWIPYIYPPLYSWLVALSAYVMGLDYGVARAWSVLGVGAASLALVFGARREGASWGVSIAAAALFISTYEQCGAFFDIVRNDGVLIGLLSWSWVTARGGRSLTSGVLLALAFAAKHSVAVFGVPMLAWLWWKHGKRVALRFALASVVPALFFVIVMQVRTDGVFLTYLLGVPSSHPYVLARLFPGAPMELFLGLGWATGFAGIVLLAQSAGKQARRQLFLGVALLASALAVWWVGDWADLGELKRWSLTLDPQTRKYVSAFTKNPNPIRFTVGVVLALPVCAVALRWRPWSESDRFWWPVGVLVVVLCAVMRSHVGGYLNVLIPGFWLLALATALAGDWLGRRLGFGGRLAVALLFSWQLYDGRWEPAKFIPTSADREAGDAFIETLAGIEGDVLAPHFPYYPVLAGKSGGFHLIALWDIDHPKGILQRASRDVDEQIAGQRWGTIILATDKFGHGLKKHYRKSETLRVPGGALFPQTGWHVRPQSIWVPIETNDL